MAASALFEEWCQSVRELAASQYEHKRISEADSMRNPQLAPYDHCNSSRTSSPVDYLCRLGIPRFLLVERHSSVNALDTTRSLCLLGHQWYDGGAPSR